MGIYNAYMALSGAYDADVTREERMAQRTTYRIGGRAALFIEAHSYIALVRVLRVLEREQVPWVVLGRCSNVLVADEGYSGCVIRLGKEFARIDLDARSHGISAGCGALLSKLVSSAQGGGLSGLERCVGVPGTVGGALRLNAGTHDEWIGSLVTSVVTLSAQEGMRRHVGSDISWGHRATSIPPEEIILEATFSLSVADRMSIASDMERRLAARRQLQPIGQPSCGAVFRDAGDMRAEDLIGASGLSGFAVGGAAVSEVNANFIVNRGGATAADVMAVIDHVHEVVLAKRGVDLKLGIRCLGFA